MTDRLSLEALHGFAINYWDFTKEDYTESLISYTSDDKVKRMIILSMLL